MHRETLGAGAAPAWRLGVGERVGGSCGNMQGGQRCSPARRRRKVVFLTMKKSMGGHGVEEEDNEFLAVLCAGKAV